MRWHTPNGSNQSERSVFKRFKRADKSVCGSRQGLHIEVLETRALLSVTLAGPEFQVNAYPTTQFIQTAMASDPSGDYVVAWANLGQDGSGYGIYARRYDASGTAQGSSFLVNTYTTSDQFAPSVAMDTAGEFVVVWDSSGQDGSGHGVYAQRYNASGVPQGSEFKVNTYTTGNQIGLTNNAVAMDSGGDFVVDWQSNLQDGSGYGIYAQRYNAAGVAQGSEFHVNTFTTDNQLFASVAMDSAGDLVVVWSSQGQDGSGYGVYGQRYNAAGAAQAGEFRVNTFTTGDQGLINTPGSPGGLVSVAMDAAGDFVVVWQSQSQDGSGVGIFAQLYEASGAVEGSEFRVNTYTTANQIIPSVAMDAAGDFVVAWDSYGQDGSSYGAYAQRYSACGVPQGGEFRTNAFTTNAQVDPAVVMDRAGDFVVEWSSFGQGSAAGGIFARRYIVEQGGAEVRVNSHTISAQINPVVASDAAGDYVVAWQSALQDGSGYGIYAQRYNSVGVAQGSEFKVNTYTTLNQNNPSVAMDSAGDFVVAWQSYAQDGNLYGIYAQRYNPAGVAQGSEFKVNTFTTLNQTNASVAMDSNGDFVVAWQSYAQDGSLWGIYAQRYNPAGVAQGSEFIVNTHTTFSQTNPSVAMDTAGDFVVAWQSYGQDSAASFGIFAQRYNASGVAQGSEFQANTFTTANQFFPSVAMDSAGDFVVAWQSYTQDGSLWGIYAQRYNAAGVAQGSEFRVNTYTTFSQENPSVALDSAGDFVVAWESYGQDSGNSFGIFAQRYNASGAAQGFEFPVNTYTTANQKSAAVAMDSAGEFVVAWQSYAQDGSGYGIYAKQYFAASSIVGRNLFYAGSTRYDLPGGSNGQTPNAYSDDNAIATDKTAYLPGSGPATMANISSYDKGINGIVIDLAGPHSGIMDSDFVFKVGNNNSPNLWSAAPAPTCVMVNSGSGVGGSDRIELIWPDGAIQQQWIEVTVLATADTGLAANDVFFFGNEIGCTGVSNTATVARVASSDVTGAQTHGASFKANIPVTNIYDFNKDGLVNSSDVTDAQTHGTSIKTGLQLINIGAGGPFAPKAAPVGSSDSGIVSALASTSTSPTPSAIPPWIANRLAHLDLNRVDLNSGPLARYFEHLAHEGTTKAKDVLVAADEVAEAANLDDELLDSLVGRLGS